jgi:hypothetical protein
LSWKIVALLFIDEEDYAALEKFPKNIIFVFFSVASEYLARIPVIAGSIPTCKAVLFSFLKA